ncbi:MAG TPA: hypothetical protein VMJ52_01450 [Xanthobacteraceae bacterium]|nr:hypothetical protein [Xanthobacteraceae bacterium]
MESPSDLPTFLSVPQGIEAAFIGEGGFMAKRAKKRRAWTTVEVRDLKSMARKKTPAGKIAKKLRRSEGATRQKAFSIGLSLDSRS